MINYKNNGEVESISMYNKEAKTREKIEAEVIEDNEETGVKVIQCGDFSFIYENGLLTSYPEVFNDFDDYEEETSDKSLACNVKYDTAKDMIIENSGTSKLFFYFGKSCEEKFEELRKEFIALEGEEKPMLIVEFVNGSNFNTTYKMFSLYDSICTTVMIDAAMKKAGKNNAMTLRYVSEDDVQVYTLSGTKSEEDEHAQRTERSIATLKRIDSCSAYYYPVNYQSMFKSGCMFDMVDEFGYNVYTREYTAKLNDLVVKEKVKSEDNVINHNLKSISCGTIRCYCESFAVFDIVDGKMKRVDIPSGGRISREFNYDF